MSPPAYAFPLHALRRWRDERLTLTPEADGTERADFHFDGSTCGNVPFHLVYTVRIAPAADRHRVLALACAPAPGDHGHERMCCCLEDPGAIPGTLRPEVPMLGQPLAAVLGWRPVTSPAGCLCVADFRAHKWLAVLQTLHYALAGRATPRPVLS